MSWRRLGSARGRKCGIARDGLVGCRSIASSCGSFCYCCRLFRGRSSGSSFCCLPFTCNYCRCLLLLLLLLVL